MPSKILVVDDDAFIRTVLKTLLEREHHVVLFAESGEAAIAIARRDLPDLIILDLMLPGMNGYDTCEALSADPKTRTIPVFFLSSNQEIEARIRGLNMGAVDYVPKPFNAAELMARIRVRLKTVEHMRIREEALTRLQEETIVDDPKNTPGNAARTVFRRRQESVLQGRDEAPIEGNFEELIVRLMTEGGVANIQQISAARALQSECKLRGESVSFEDVLVKEGIVTLAQFEGLKKKVLALQKGTRQLGTYHLLRKLGEGATGCVYLAHDPSETRKVAIKALSPRYSTEPHFLSRFRREAQAAAELKHPNIVAAFKVGEDLGQFYYVMEYCEGESLEARIKRERTLAWPEAIEIVLQVASGLQYAHERGFIHRDIKPANIFITNERTVKILDLGLSKNIADDEHSFATSTGVILGTPHYISPEQVLGEKDVDGRTDIYSLGATLYHMLTGETPFNGQSSAAIIVKHLNEHAPSAGLISPDVPESVCAIVKKMMAKQRDQRHASCAELIEQLHSPLKN